MAGMSSDAIRAGKAFVEIGANDSALEKGLRAAEKKLKSWGGGLMKVGGVLTAAGGGVFGALGLALKSFTETGTELSHTSAQLGMSVENLSLLKEVAAESGVEFEDLTKAIGKFQAGLGGTEAGKALQELGVDLGALNGKTTTEQLEMVVDALAKMKDQAGAMKAARELFGKGGGRLLGLARQSGGLRGAMGEAGAAGLGITTKDAETAEEFDRLLTRVGSSAKMAAFAIGGELAAEVMKYKGAIQGTVGQALRWVEDHKQIALVVAGVAGGLVVAGGGFVALGAVLSGLGTTLGVVAAAAGFLTTWPGIIAVAAAGLAVLWARSSEGQRAISSLASGFEKMKDTAVDSVGLISEAIKAGDWGAAGKVGMMALQLEILTGLREIEKAFGFTFTNAAASVIDAFSRMRSKVKAFEAEKNAGIADYVDKVMSSNAHPERLRQQLRDIAKLQHDDIRKEMARRDPFWAGDMSSRASAKAAAAAAGGKQKDEFERWFEKQAEAGQQAQEEAAKAGHLPGELPKGLPDILKPGAFDEQIKKLNEELDRLRQQLANARPEKIGMPGKPGDDSLAKQIQAGIGEAAKGTFSSYALGQSLAVPDKFQEKIKTATEKTAENTKDLVDLFRGGGQLTWF